MSEQKPGYDYDRYRRLLADATDESKRLALIDMLIEEGARDQLTRERISRLGLTGPSEPLHHQNNGVSAIPPSSTVDRGEVG